MPSSPTWTSSNWPVLKLFSLTRRKSTKLNAAAPTPPDPGAESSTDSVSASVLPITVPEKQTVALLRAARQPYEIVDNYAVPGLEKEDDVLVKTQFIGLNPIDWKAPDFNFAIPTLPYISGRESSGLVAQANKSRFHPNDKVIVISTDYRDLRKATYQEYVIAPSFNLARIPPQIPTAAGATLGVAFAASALALGLCLGVDFSHVHAGPDLISLLSLIPADRIPTDVRTEALAGIPLAQRARSGDTLVVWGASATSAHVAMQLAQLAGLRVIAVLDMAKHGVRVTQHKTLRPVVWVDNNDAQRAVEIVRRSGPTRFALDTVGKSTVGVVAAAIQGPEAHVVGLAGLPKETAEGIKGHAVPIKLFHEVREVGAALTEWLERLLETGALVPPDILDVQQGFEELNAGLDRMRSGDISGGKLVVQIS